MYSATHLSNGKKSESLFPSYYRNFAMKCWQFIDSGLEEKDILYNQSLYEIVRAKD